MAVKIVLTCCNGSSKLACSLWMVRGVWRVEGGGKEGGREGGRGGERRINGHTIEGLNYFITYL